MLITPERKVPQRSDASQNDHKSKGYPAKTSAAKVGYRRQYPTFASGFLLDFLKSGSTALVSNVSLLYVCMVLLLLWKYQLLLWKQTSTNCCSLSGREGQLGPGLPAPTLYGGWSALLVSSPLSRISIIWNLDQFFSFRSYHPLSGPPCRSRVTYFSVKQFLLSQISMFSFCSTP